MQTKMKEIELDFKIGEVCSGRDGIINVFNRLFPQCKGNGNVTALAIALWRRCKITKLSPTLCRCYKGLWQRVDSWCLVNLHQQDFDSYINATKSFYAQGV